MAAGKIKKPMELKKIIADRRKKDGRVAFTNGCFDILHLGHAQYLEKAKRCADILVVAVNSDNSVRRIKGRGRPIFALKDRMKLIAFLESVDYVTSFNEDTPENIIRYLRPDIIIKGADYRLKDIIGADIVAAYGGKVKRINYLRGYSATHIINKMASGRGKR